MVGMVCTQFIGKPLKRRYLATRCTKRARPTDAGEIHRRHDRSDRDSNLLLSPDKLAKGECVVSTSVLGAVLHKQ